MTDAPLPDLVLYGRPGCGLCDEARSALAALLEERAQAGLPSPTLSNATSRPIRPGSAPTSPRSRSSSSAIDASSSRTSVAKLRRLMADVLDA